MGGGEYKPGVRVEVAAMRFVILMGLVSLFADVTYEGGRSIAGPYLSTLGASALVVGWVAGLGEFLGYATRLLSGYGVDRTRRPWVFLWVGYAMNVLAIPALGWVTRVPTAALLLLTERFGKGFRTPARDTLLARSGRHMGHGWAFGLHEALDQIGATLGPLLVAVGLGWGGYRTGFGVLLPAALMALALLAIAERWAPTSRMDGEDPGFQVLWVPRLGRLLLFVGLHLLAFPHFILMAYHMERAERLAGASIALLYALAMVVDAISALALGKAYDRWGFRVIALMPVTAAAGAVLVFGTSAGNWEVVGVMLWGVALGLQESLLKAMVATLVPYEVLGRAYGVFHTVFGVAWMVGSVWMGALYQVHLPLMVGLIVGVQALALVVLMNLQTSAR